jgi:hypothetical protein
MTSPPPVHAPDSCSCFSSAGFSTRICCGVDLVLWVRMRRVVAAYYDLNFVTGVNHAMLS